MGIYAHYASKQIETFVAVQNSNYKNIFKTKNCTCEFYCLNYVLLLKFT